MTRRGRQGGSPARIVSEVLNQPSGAGAPTWRSTIARHTSPWLGIGKISGVRAAGNGRYDKLSPAARARREGSAQWDASLNCLAAPDTWNPGNWQIINEQFRRTAEAPWWGLESFADNHMEERDEIWFGITYQF